METEHGCRDLETDSHPEGSPVRAPSRTVSHGDATRTRALWLAVISLTLVPTLVFVIADARYDAIGEPTSSDWCSQPSEYFDCYLSFESTPAEKARTGTIAFGVCLNAVLMAAAFCFLLVSARRAKGHNTSHGSGEIGRTIAAYWGIGGLAVLGGVAARTGVFGWPIMLIVHACLLAYALHLHSRTAPVE